MAMYRVLVIDDEKIIRERLKKLLELDGYKTFIAGGGKKGLDIFTKEKPDIALVDIKMPGMDGIELLKKIKEKSKETEVIIITGHGGVDTAIQALREGAFGYIQKPIEYDELEIEIRRALERKEMQRKLDEYVHNIEESKDYIDNIIKSMSDTLIVVNSDAIIQTVNRATLDLLGYEEDEIIGKPISTIFAKEEEEEEVFKGTGIEDLIKKEFVRNIEKTYHSKEGKEIPVLFSGSVMRDDNGNIQGIVCVAMDITELKRAEEALRISQESFHNIVERNADSIIVTDREGIVRFVNSTTQVLFNRKADEFIGQLFGFALAANEFTEIDIIRPDGETGVGEMRVAETRWEDKTAYLISVRDITDRKQAEKALRQSKDYINNIISSMIESLVVTNWDGNIKKVNKATCELSGYEEKELIGKPIGMFFAEEEEEEELNALGIEEIITKGFIRNVERAYLSKDGRSIPILFSGSVMRTDDDEIQGIVCLAKNITEQKRAEAELKKRLDELERFERVTVGRELKMIELKNKIKELEEQLKLKKTNG